MLWAFLVALVVRNLSANAGELWVGKIPWNWQFTSLFLPGESRGQRSLAGYCPWGHKESDTAEVT